MRGGTLPGRKPLTRTCWATLRYAASTAGSQLVERHLDGQLDAGGAESLDGALHRGDATLLCWGSPGARLPSGLVGAGRLELPISCSQSRRASHYATPRGAASDPTGPAQPPPRGRSSMVEPQPSKLAMPVRSRSPALIEAPGQASTSLTGRCATAHSCPPRALHVPPDGADSRAATDSLGRGRWVSDSAVGCASTGRPRRVTGPTRTLSGLVRMRRSTGYDSLSSCASESNAKSKSSAAMRWGRREHAPRHARSGPRTVPTIDRLGTWSACAFDWRRGPARPTTTATAAGGTRCLDPVNPAIATSAQCADSRVGVPSLGVVGGLPGFASGRSDGEPPFLGQWIPLIRFV